MSEKNYEDEDLIDTVVDKVKETDEAKLIKHLTGTNDEKDGDILSAAAGVGLGIATGAVVGSLFDW